MYPQHHLVMTAVAALLITSACTSNERMIEAASDGETGTVLELLADGADPAFRSRSPDRQGHTALSAAASAGRKGTVEAILRKGVRPQEQPEAIVAAARSGELPILKILLDHGADPNAMLPAISDGQEINTALGAAAKGGHLKVVRTLLASKAQSKAFDSVALREATRSGRIEIVRLLVKQGASVSSQGPDGKLPIHIASDRKPNERRGINRGALIRFLRRNGAEIDAKDTSGDTALMLAVRGEVFRHVEILLELGASPDQKCAEGMTPRQWATSYKDRSPEMQRIARFMNR